MCTLTSEAAIYRFGCDTGLRHGGSQMHYTERYVPGCQWVLIKSLLDAALVIASQSTNHTQTLPTPCSTRATS